MFSKLDGIFPGLPPRHVENANARLEIRRDESQGQGKKKNDHADSEYSPIPWEDISYVSIASLKAFLLSVVQPENEPPAPTAHVHAASNTRNARAASAYQSMGRAVHDSNMQNPTPETPPSHIETNFTEDDLARIRVFISNLIELERDGKTELGMQRNANFLDSLEAAIAAAKAS